MVVSPGDLQCQRTARYFSGSIDGETWICPICPDHEGYRRVEPDHLASRTAADATAMCRREFGVADDGLRMVVWLGEPIPQIFFQPHLGEWHIYVGRGASPWQIALQGGHEAFHRVCSPPALLHWADEMLAVLFSLHYLDQIRDHDNAAANRALFCEDSLQCSREQMKAARTIPYPHGFYGRAYVVGSALCEAVGWEALKPLALRRNADRTADVRAWLDSLPPDRQAAAVAALGD